MAAGACARLRAHLSSSISQRAATICENGHAAGLESASDGSQFVLKKGSADTLSLELTRTPDAVAAIGYEGLVKVGFAAETDDVEQNASAKIALKGLHFIAANDVTDPGSGFGSDTNRVVLIDREGRTQPLDLPTKYKVAHRILDEALSYCNT